MKKLLMMIVILFVVSALFAGTFSIGASFGTSGSSEKSISASTQLVESSKFGYVIRLRGDYKFAEKYSATLMISYDSPSKAIILNGFKGYNLKATENLSYLKIFVGATMDFDPKGDLLIAVGIGPELCIDLKSGAVGAAATTYGRFSYALGDTGLMFDSTVKGSLEWIKDLPDDDVHFYLDGDVSLGFTYTFK